jgi:hypothetical protein
MPATLAELKEGFLNLKSEVSALLDNENRKAYSHLQNYLYFAHYPLFSFAESVIVLCEHGKYNSANVLLRTLIEAHINIVYHQLNDFEHKLALSAKGSFDQKITIIKKIQDLIRKYSNLESNNPHAIFNREYLENTLKWAESQRKNVMAKNNILLEERDLSLEAKAVKCDKEYTGNIEKGHFERIYTVIYRYLSPFTHLDIEGLDMFVSKKDASQYLFHDGSVRDEHLAFEAVDVCLAFSKDLYDLGLIKGNRTDAISNIERFLLQRTTN